MKKLLVLTAAILTLTTSTVFANTALTSANIKNVFPHAVTKDGGLVIEGKLTATDYASILLASTGVQDNEEAARKKVASTYLDLMGTSERLFVKQDGSVLSSYDYKDNLFSSNNKVDITAVTHFSLAYNDAVQNAAKFNDSAKYKNMLVDTAKYKKMIENNNKALTKLKKNSAQYKRLIAENARYQELINKSLKYEKLIKDASIFEKSVVDKARKNGLTTAKYVINNMYSDGRFYDDSTKAKIDYKTMANGMLSLYSAWSLETNTINRIGISAEAKKVYDFLEASWNKDYNVFVFSGNAELVKFDLGHFGLLLWGSKELSQILAQSGYGYEAVNIMKMTSMMRDKVLVKGVTYKNEGIAREIQVAKGIVSVSNDTINIGRLHTFLYGFTKWNESPFSKLLGTEAQNIKFIKDMILYSTRNYVDGFAAIHDVKFSNVSERDDSKETPYINWFMISSDYILEKHRGYFTEGEIKEINKAILKNYDFLTNKIKALGVQQ